MRRVLMGLAAVGVVLVVGLCIVFLPRMPESPDEAAPSGEYTVDTARESAPPPEQVPAAPGDAATTDESAPAEPKQEPEDEGPALTRVYGTVTAAATGAPIAGATVVAAPKGFVLALDTEKADEASTEERDEVVETDTDEAGVYSLEVALGDKHALSCRSEGFVAEHKPLSRWAGEEQRVDFHLRAGSSVSGVVTDIDTGEGVAGVKVRARGSRQSFFEMVSRNGDKLRDTPTQDDGSYSIDGLEPGSYLVSVHGRKAGYLFNRDDRVTLNLEKGMVYEGVDFTVERGAVVEGEVMNPSQEPVPQAKVAVMPAQLIEAAMKGLETMDLDALADLTEKTDADGRFRIVGLSFDTEYRLQGEAEGYASASSAPFRVARDGSPARVDLVLTTGSTVSGTARYSDGSPAKEYKLALQPDLGAIFAGEITDQRHATTAADGGFEVKHVGAGKYVLSGSDTPPFDFFGKSQGVVRIEVDGINDVRGVELVLEAKEEAEPEGTGVIEGNVLSPREAPVPGVRVEAKRSDKPKQTSGATTAEDGRFALKKLKGRKYDLSVKCDQGYAEMGGVAVGSDVTLRLAPPTCVSGQVVAKDGSPAVSCKVKLEQKDKPPPANPFEVIFSSMLPGGLGGETTDVNGFFEFKNVDPGTYIVEAKSETEGTGESETITVQAGVSVTNVRIRLEPGVTFSGTVENGERQPVSGATVSLTPSGEDDLAGMIAQFLPEGMRDTAGSTTSDGEGRFAITNVAPGVYSVSATHSAYARTVVSGVEVEAGRDVTGYRVVLTPGGTASGRLVVDGEPRSGVMVQLLGPGGMHMATTDSEGRFELSGIAPGTYVIQSIDMGKFSAEGLTGLQTTPRLVDIADGEHTDIDLGPGAGATVSGAVVGDLEKFTQISLRRPGGPAPEDMDPFDFSAAMEAMEYFGGQAVVGEDGAFHIDGVEPGTYILEVFSLDIDFTNPANIDFQALMEMERSPRIRQEIVVGDEPVTLNLELPVPE